MQKTPKADRIQFFSKEDITCSQNLSLAEPILRTFEPARYEDVNDIIELYQIKLFVDNGVFLTNWIEKDIIGFKETVKEIWNHVCQFWIKINDENIVEIFNILEIGNQRDFWRLTENLKAYKSISEDIFTMILKLPDLWIREVLNQKNLVKHFDKSIKSFLLEYKNTAELLLSQYEENHPYGHVDMNFPKSLSCDDIETIILKYLDSENPNLNYVRLIKNSKELKFSAHTKLNAKEVEKKLNNELFDEQNSKKFGIEVYFTDDQVEPTFTRWENDIFKASYSNNWIKSNLDYPTLFHNFYSLFNYIDSFGRITLVSKEHELDVFERIIMRSKNDYLYGSAFYRKHLLSIVQIISYSRVLEKNGIAIETVLANFLTDYVNKQFGINGYRICFPSESSTWLEKVRMIAPELEYILKQYKIFVEDGVINQSLLQIGSEPCHLKEIPSLVNKKYAYGMGDEINRLKYLFFSDQSPLYYVKPFEQKHHNFYSLLENENVSFENFQNYQRPGIDLLIKEGYLKIDYNGFVKINCPINILIISDLYNNEVISYWQLSYSFRKVVDEMAINGMIFFENSLLSKPEQMYFNYNLNKAEFTNGLDLRNKYVHGSNGDSEEEHRNAYFIFLRLLVLAMLKIEEDLSINLSLNSLT